MNKDYTVVTLPNGEKRIYLHTSLNLTEEDMCKKNGCNTVQELYEKLTSIDDENDSNSH